MELLKAAGCLLAVGLVIVAVSASLKNAGIVGKIAIGIGQVVFFIGAVLLVIGAVVEVL